MPRTNVDEVYNDFKNANFKISYDKGYNPNSDEFMTALRIGLMWLVMKECSGTRGAASMHESEGKSEMSVMPKTDMSADDDIAEELHDAKKYHQMYLDTQDETYQSMAKDELSHAMTLIRKASAKTLAAEEKMKMKQYEEEYKRLSEQM